MRVDGKAAFGGIAIGIIKEFKKLKMIFHNIVCQISTRKYSALTWQKEW